MADRRLRDAQLIGIEFIRRSNTPELMFNSPLTANVKRIAATLVA